jgi:alginate O-acetyltransferase complex protein AlgI
VSLTSPVFFVALALAGIAYYAMPGRSRAALLLFLSYLFYASVSKLFLGLLIVASGVTYFIGLRISSGRSETIKSFYMTVGVAALVAVIVTFKAFGAWKGFLLPLGLSYYSFKLISYVIDVYWDAESVERDPVLFFLYPAFFPQIVSGPIQRPHTFFDQMRQIMSRGVDDTQVETGFRYILGGLMLKQLLGDRLGAFVSAVDGAPGAFSHGVLLAAVACYTLQLYADFAGYTNIALGVGKIFGVEGPPNFNAPFAAVNIQEMWRRWHMSLTTWLTDYLFTPLSMSLRGLGQTGLIICIVLNMVIIGLWHGLTLNFLVFGLLHAAFLTITVFVIRRFGRSTKGKPEIRAEGFLLGERAGRLAKTLGGMILTFALMSFSQIFFHSPTWDSAIAILEQVLGFTPSGTMGLTDLGAGFAVSVWLSAAVTIFVGSGAPGVKRVTAAIDEIVPRSLQNGFWLFLLTTLSAQGGSQFIYGQF